MNKKDLSTRDLHLIRSKMWDASMNNHKQFLDPQTGLFNIQFTETRNCPVCSSNINIRLFSKSGGVYVLCDKCSLIFLNPVLKDSYLKQYYENNHTVQGEMVDLDMEFYSKIYRSGLDKISNILPKKGKILDIGCSTGNFLDIAKIDGWDSYGLELNKSEAAASLLKGHQVLLKTIEEADFNIKFDAITLWDVFEHIKQGMEFLIFIKKFLNKNSVVFIQTPTTDSFAARSLQSKCNMFDGLEHVNLYNKKSLEALCVRAGYQIINFGTIISEIGVINNYLSYEDPYLGSSQNKTSILELINDEILLEKNMGYKLQACLVMG